MYRIPRFILKIGMIVGSTSNHCHPFDIDVMYVCCICLQLQQCVQERVATRCVELHVQERHRSGPNPSAAAMAAHQRRAERLLREEHAFKMCIVSTHTTYQPT